MRHHNSQNIGFYTELLVCTYQDLVGAIIPQNEIERDIEEIRKRVRYEGITFLTKTLPQLGKSIDKSLANGSPLLVRGFKTAYTVELPRIFAGLFRELYRADGVPRSANVDPDVILLAANLHAGDDVDCLPSWIDRTFYEMAKVSHDYAIANPDDIRSQCYKTWLDIAILCSLTGQVTERCRSLHTAKYLLAHWVLGSAMTPEDNESLVSAYETYGLTEETRTAWAGDRTCSALRERRVVALKALRQLCFMFYKLEVPYAIADEQRVISDFVETDALLTYESKYLEGITKEILKQARKIILRVTANSDPSEGVPKHGPGSVATGESPGDKHLFKRYYRRLAEKFPYDKWFLLNDSALCDQLDWLQSLEEHEAGTAKVVLVPKDSRGPRLISCEPLEYQWIQQALCGLLVETIEKHPLTRGRVNFADQTCNRNLALEGSKPPYRWVTLDMKEASDRVSLNLVKDLFSERWYEHLYASRSASTRLPSGDIVSLKKFAPMGSAVCFPVESLIFWALCVAILMNTYNLPLRKAATKVYVYGDDIVCDAFYHGVLTQYLPEFGLLLNEDKCCRHGPFKESCGMDAFLGMPVTPTKIRSLLDSPVSGNLQSWIAYSNAFHREGLTRAAEHIRVELQWLLRSHRMHPIPTVSSGEPSVFAFVRPDCRVAVENSKRYLRYNRKLQRLEVLGYTYRSRLEKAKTEGWELALRILADYERRQPDTGEVLKDTPPPKQLLTGQYPIAHRVKLQRAWTPVA